MPGSRSYTGHHNLIPSQTFREPLYFPQESGHFSGAIWTFGTGSVIWRIWPAVALHTVFAAVVVIVSHETRFNLAIPPVLLTIVGVVIGFVLSYRASSGYDRFWMGRGIWGDVIRNCRTAGRLVWFHIPPRLTPDKNNVTQGDIDRVINEKKVALDLIEGFAFALKHHLRSEIGPYYEDMYPLIRALETNPNHHHPDPPTSPRMQPFSPASAQAVPMPQPYGAVTDGASANGETAPLLPSNQPRPSIRSSVYMDLIPFSSIFSTIGGFFRNLFKRSSEGKSVPPKRKRRVRPRIAGGGGGQNIPLEIVRALSEWLAVLDERGTINGVTLGGLHGCLQGFEDCITGAEKILTTPLPFVYSVHIRHTVWMYLFFLPFQLTDQFGYTSIPGVGIAAFFFLGLLAAGEEIEEPFGNDANDIDLDLFCNEIVHAEICELAKTSCPNSYLALPSSVGDSPFGSNGSVVDHVKREMMDENREALAGSSTA